MNVSSGHNMTNHKFNRRKSKRSPHQKQILRFTIVAMAGCAVLVAALLWWINRSGLPAH
jgi:hypothetical protein